jgi:SAM-dependent methyltransferase
MPDLNWNKVVWDTTYGWHDGGEEWSTAWGGSEAQRFGSIFPRLHRFFPPRRILEIAPGFGRWTKFLIPVCDKLVGIDLSPKCVDACRNKFATCNHAHFLPMTGNPWRRHRTKNLIWFFRLIHSCTQTTRCWRRTFPRFCVSCLLSVLLSSTIQIFSNLRVPLAISMAVQEQPLLILLRL